MMTAVISDVELRGFENRRNKNNEDYGILNFEDSDYASHRLIFKDLSLNNKLMGCRGKVADLVCEIELGAYANIRLVDVVLE
jgi:hypothetical protein